jgi:hypothetical protein
MTCMGWSLLSVFYQFKEQLPAIREFEESNRKIAETVRFNKQSRGRIRSYNLISPIAIKE